MNVWVEAARPKTLPAGVAPVLVGTAAADRFVAWRFVAALVVGVAVQIGVNYANDYFDGVSGVDTTARVGPRRAVAAGLVRPAAMLRATAVAFGVASAAGLLLAAAVSWWLLAVGAAAILAALGYSGGPRPYGSAALGEVSVFVFFGLVATAGSQFVQDGRLSGVAMLAGIPMGLLATALLVTNNLRDIPTDTRAGKRTLAVLLGERRTRRLHQGLVVAALVATAAVAAAAASGWPLLALLAAPLAASAARGVASAPPGPDLVPVLEATARTHLVYGALLAAGLVLA